MLNKLVLSIFLMLFASSAYAQKVCVFDPAGKNGEIYPRALDFSTEFLTLGVTLELVPFNYEKDVVNEFVNGSCDAMVVTGFTARNFNRFAATLEAPGAIPSYEIFRDVLSTIASPKAAPLFKEKGYEVTGIFPMGVVYMYVNDEELYLPSRFEGKRFQLFNADPLKEVYARNWKVQPVYTDTTNIAENFKEGKVDAMVLPAAATVPFEIDKSLERFDGRVIDLPLAYITLQVIIKSNRFPADFGQQAREISLDYYEESLELAFGAEAVLKPYKKKLSPALKKVWRASLEETQAIGRQRNLYHPKMLKIMERIRCRHDAFEAGC